MLVFPPPPLPKLHLSTTLLSSVFMLVALMLLYRFELKDAASDGRSLRLGGASSLLGHLISAAGKKEADLASNASDGRSLQVGVCS